MQLEISIMKTMCTDRTHVLLLADGKKILQVKHG